jgi:tetratricopeptide (TPR) repeat protein
MIRKSIFCLMFLLSLQTVAAQSSSVADEVKRLIARAKTAYGMQEYRDALDEYQKAQKLVPNYPVLYKAIGDVYENLGGDDDLKAAIESYGQYLKLSPDAEDRSEIQERIASLEYKFEKQVKQTQILNDLSGLWISDRVAQDNSIFSEYKDRPYVILEIREIQQTGNYRATLHPHSTMYEETFVNKTVNITPQKNNSFRFIYADTKVYNPSSAQYNGLRAILGAAGGSDTFQGLGNFAIDLAQENDLPSNTETSYDFDLKYNNGKLTGLLNIRGKHATLSGAGTKQSNQDEIRQNKNG